MNSHIVSIHLATQLELKLVLCNDHGTCSEICKADGVAFLWTPLSENESRAADGVSFDCAASVLSLAFKRL